MKYKMKDKIKNNKSFRAMTAYILALAVFTAYVVMDTFFISRVYGDEAAQNISGETGAGADAGESAESGTDSSQSRSSGSASPESGDSTADDEEAGNQHSGMSSGGHSGKGGPGSGSGEHSGMSSGGHSGKGGPGKGGGEHSGRGPGRRNDGSADSSTGGSSSESASAGSSTDSSGTGGSSSGSSGSTGSSAKKKVSAAASSSSDSYSDDNISVTLKEYRENDTTIYVADVTVSNPSYLKTAFAQGSYGRNVTAATSETAESVDAVLAINGDYYGAQQKGYVIRNGELYRSTALANQEDLVIYKDGSFGVISESKVTAEELIKNGAVNVLSFGPALLQDGKIAVNESEEVGMAMASNPRTAIGIIDENHYVFVVSDGRTSESTGLSLYQLAEFMEGLGARTAYNLDGGGSSTMYFNGSVVNNPTTGGNTSKERSVSDIVYIG